MPDPTLPPAPQTAPRRGPISIVVVLGLLVIAALAGYLFSMRERETPTIKLALLTWTQDPFWEPLVRGAQDYAEQANVELTIVQSKPTVEEQTQHIKTLLGSGIVGIAISPNDAAAQAAILNDAAAKMPVVTFDTDAPDSKRKRFVGIDNYAAGHMAADELREAMPEGGAVLITVGSATMQHGRDRRQGVIDGLIERGFDRDRAPDAIDAPLKGSKYSIVATVTDGADPAKATAAIAEALKAHPEVKGIIGLFSYSAPAALEAMKQVGKTGQIKVVGFDESDETQAALASGAIHSSVLQDTYRAGYEAIRVLADEARNVARGPAEQSPIVNVRINVLTADNLAEMRESGAIRLPGGTATTKPAG
jgi:ribose transport system substrate-binding protein